MSSLEVYKVQLDGSVVAAGSARNSWCGAFLIWKRLGEKYGTEFDLLKPKPTWDLFGSGRMSRQEDLVMGLTFDAVWIAREHLAEVCAALRVFVKHHVRAGEAPTLAKAISILEPMIDDETVRGACFNVTSVNSNPWNLYDESADENRSVIVGKDTEDANGNEIEELFALLQGKEDDRTR